MTRLGTCLGLVLAAHLVAGQSGPALFADHDDTESAQRDEGDAPERGMLGVLRRDGILIPFAAFKGQSWSMPWPGESRNHELPIGLDDVPEAWWGGKPPAGWHVRLASGADVPFKALAPAPYQSFCQARLGLRTDYRSSESMPPGPVVPFPKEGLAATSGVVIEPIEMVDRGSPEAERFFATLARQLQEVEDRTIATIEVDSEWRHPFKKADRQKLPIRIEAWYRAPMVEPGWTASYVEAVRSYPPQPEDKGCGLETLFSGWVLSDQRDTRPNAEFSARVTYCDRIGGMYMLPFGRIRLKDRMYWIFQYSGWEQEWFDVVRVTPRRLKFEAEFYGGGRRDCRPPIRR
jgi:hypothetical protein